MRESENSSIKILEDEEFRKIATFVESEVGIKMPKSKKLMMQTRLQPRLKALNLNNFSDYLEYLFSSEQTKTEESIYLIDAITTNLTHFYREPNHFDYLTSDVIPTLINSGVKNLNIWSAGCSSGEEAYTLSIVIEEYKTANLDKIFDYSILATDVSTKVLEKARNAIYSVESVKSIPVDIKNKYFEKNKESEKTEFRIKPEFSQKVQFQRLNFMEDDFSVEKEMNIIFCRNVLMYFDKSTQEEVLKKFMKYLAKDGYLFLGHSETIYNMDLPLKTVAPTVFQKI